MLIFCRVYGLGFFVEKFRGWRCFPGKNCLSIILGKSLGPLSFTSWQFHFEQHKYQTFPRKLSLRNCPKNSTTCAQTNESEEWAPFTVLVIPPCIFSFPSTNSLAVAFFSVSRESVKALVPLKMRTSLGEKRGISEENKHRFCSGVARKSNTPSIFR